MKPPPAQDYAAPWPDPEPWTEEQRRRAEALCLAALLLPAAEARALIDVARFICTGALRVLP